MLLITRYHTLYNWLVIGILSWVLYVIFVIVVNFGTSYNSVATMFIAFTGGKFYVDFILIVGTCAIIDFLTLSIWIMFDTSLAGKLMILVRERNGLNSKVDLPKKILNLLKLCESKDEEEDENDNHRIDKCITKDKEINIIKVDNRRANEIDLEKVDGVSAEQIELSHIKGHKLKMDSDHI